MASTKQETSYKSIWDTLSKVDVSEHIKQIKTNRGPNLSYLSWAWAWGVLMQHYPQARVHWIQNGEGVPVGWHRHADSTVTVYCQVDIDGLTRDMWLPVMDARNNSVENPTSRDISDAKMRCLVKCLALFGLGHYIYAGEDLPTPDSGPSPEETKAQEEIESAREHLKSAVEAAKQEGIEIPDDLKKRSTKAYKQGTAVEILAVIDEYLSLKDEEDDG